MRQAAMRQAAGRRVTPQACRVPGNARQLRPVTCSAAVQQATASVSTSYDVQKFGGTCMATGERVRKAAQLMAETPGNLCVVVSAMGSTKDSPVKVTDILLKVVAKATSADTSYSADLDALHDKHRVAARELLGASPAYDQFLAALDKDISNLKAVLQAITIAGVSTDAYSDYVVGHGELWCARLFSAACTQMGVECAFLDARDVLVVASDDGNNVTVDFVESAQRLSKWLAAHPSKKICATGFIARDKQGRPTTLKRNGSDYSATIFGALLNSREITIWTDVDGVFSADPRKVPEAVCLKTMTYNEAWELAYFGANVLHPRTTLPAMQRNIPISIRNFFNLSAPGTQITRADEDTTDVPVKGFAVIDNVTLISVEGTGMAGVPGIASTIFGLMRDSDVNIIMISQASSEQSICFAVKTPDAKRAAAALNAKLVGELESGSLNAINVTDNCCVLAVVGRGMVNRKGVAATFLGALAKANVNIKAIAQGSSEYNITVLIDQADGSRALRAAHSRFYLSSVPIGLCVVGPGLIGSTFIQQVAEQAATLKASLNIDLRVMAIADSKTMLLREAGVPLDSWKEEMKTKGVPVDFNALGSFLSSSYMPNLAIVDCTAADGPPAFYSKWMKQGIHIVTPNKKMGSGPLERYHTVRRLGREGLIHFFYEGTVGAGLPIMGTLKHLMETGDTIVKIEGVFSGTLSYIFNTLRTGKAFSDIVADARRLGYTEPDPRDDLGGVDVARKVVILARECGVDLELSDIAIESLVPEPLRDVPKVDDFMAALPQYDSLISDKVAAAAKEDACLMYVGAVDVAARKATVKLQAYPRDHPFCALSGTDNIISFTTRRYFSQPLVIRGPGAGADVTAAGVFSDVLRLAAYLGAPS